MSKEKNSFDVESQDTGGKILQRRIESDTSRTAQMTCMSRAISFFETNSWYKSDDYVSVRLLPNLMRFLIRFASFRGLISRKIAPKGIYEYVIARTKYIDTVFRQALSRQFDQILVLGAGFDTRALRFHHEAGTTRMFELDVPITQNAKINQYHKRGPVVPPNLTFISTDFDKESLSTKLEEAGFKKDKRSLFILEGLLMYLQLESVDNLFQTIHAFSGTGSEFVFDSVYASVLRRENLFFGEEDIVKTVSKAGEKWQFGVERDRIEDFLRTRGFALSEYLDANALGQRYFRDESGNIVGKINGTHFLARAVKE